MSTSSLDGAWLEPWDLEVSKVFAVFTGHDSGCSSCGLRNADGRWFVKTSLTASGAASMERAVRFHAAVSHPVILRPVHVLRRDDDVRLVYPWREGRVLHQATVSDNDRTGLEAFRSLDVGEVRSAVSSVIDAHAEVAAEGFVSVDLYDGCLLYDFEARRMWLIDLDEYRPGPFVLDPDRLPGSRRFMAPEEFQRGAVIDQRTMVFTLGRMIFELFDSTHGWRGTATERAIAESATAERPTDRFPTVEALAAAWQRASR